ncbi:HEAT repeat domain-containing protein [Chitinophaga nivalis]|uniref:HEAT repeat domain-containing protein n=1 Tax=Chitinophaga nivalis TaxID=2991709 RepID=A0ABT3ILU4_9BACT|nr:HEAT repeat domain-containing protein [Chitinophaga nivalis]MCW3465427.1 HEAT repeat domain-containing protein [Chitinophaga nivalis]MCW3484881.1 HEAT repeat domain-containing protein [Chitinophaga nivalis]
MRFVRNVKLFFREGNSDKTYEIDLCEVGPEQYLVNFRYGKRSGALKEGTKTSTPVSLAAATTIFDALEKEKRSKGYLGEQEAVQDLAFVPVDTNEVGNVQHRAILKRLQGALDGKSGYKTAWKTSRVIWKAGAYKVTEAVPYLIKLIERGDALQRYATLWALGKCGDPAAIPVLQSYADNGSYPLNIRMLAANALLLTLPEAEKAAHIQAYLQRLPEVFQQTIAGNNAREIFVLLHQRVFQRTEQEYPLLEDLYIVAAGNAAVKEALVAFLTQLPLRPAYFRHIRHLFKQAELRDDQGIVGLLATRFEREAAMFTNPGTRLDYDGEEYVPNAYVAELQQSFKASKELKRPDSKLAFSDKTRTYLNRRVLRNLQAMGAQEDMQYVRLATALLLQYEESRDASKEYEVRQYAYVNGRYTTVYKQYPANSKAVFLTYITRGNAPDLHLQQNGREWYFETPADADGKKPAATTLKGNPDALKTANKGNLITKLFGWLGGEKQAATSGTPPEFRPDVATPLVTATAASEVPFLALWQKMPQAFIQLLVSAKMEVVHIFAMEQLKAHPDYNHLKEKMDEGVIAGLLANTFSIPALFGLELAREKYNPAQPSLRLLDALVASPLEVARKQGLEWIAAQRQLCLGDMQFLIHLIFSPYADVRAFVRKELTPDLLPLEKARQLCASAIEGLLVLQAATPEGLANLQDACSVLEQHAAHALKETAISVIEDLLRSPVAACHAFAARLLLLKEGNFDFEQLSDSLLQNLLSNDYAPVRASGMDMLRILGSGVLVTRPELLLFTLVATHTDVRKGIRPLITQVVQLDNRMAVYLVNELVPRLMRKETAEGIHEDIAEVLSQELVAFLHDVDTATALRLLYANYRSAQTFGVLVLEKYIPAEALTLKQVIAAGNHELRQVREWSWRFFEQQLARIRYERDGAISLLDATWDDTRDFAKTFFRTHFTENDWTPETLVAIADSVRPDIQAFGRELLMRFFREEDGQNYLLKLSQHPSAAMQLFATGYLENYAADNLAYLQELEHFFRSVLSRVNKARAAKERIFRFLEKEALRSAPAATYIGNIIAAISATVSIGDKARCIEIMRNIHRHFPEIALPIQIETAAVREN